MDTRLHDLVVKKFPSQLMVEKQRQLVKLLTSCNPNEVNAEGMTPLHLAVQVWPLQLRMLYIYDEDYKTGYKFSLLSIPFMPRHFLLCPFTVRPKIFSVLKL